MSSKTYQEAYRNMTEQQKDIMHDLYMKAINHDGHSWNMFCDIKDAVAGIINAQQWIPCSKKSSGVDASSKTMERNNGMITHDFLIGLCFGSIVTSTLWLIAMTWVTK